MSQDFHFTMRNIHNPFLSNPYGQIKFNQKVGSPYLLIIVNLDL